MWAEGEGAWREGGREGGVLAREKGREDVQSDPTLSLSLLRWCLCTLKRRDAALAAGHTDATSAAGAAGRRASTCEQVLIST